VSKARAMAPTVSKAKAMVRQSLPSTLIPTEAAKGVDRSIARYSIALLYNTCWHTSYIVSWTDIFETVDRVFSYRSQCVMFCDAA
jgi:hypothetical protein